MTTAQKNKPSDTYSGDLKPGDTFLVASDGLTGMVDDRRLQQLQARRVQPEPPFAERGQPEIRIARIGDVGSEDAQPEQQERKPEESQHGASPPAPRFRGAP